MSVLALFSSIKNLLSPKNKGADIKNHLFRASRWMAITMLICSILSSSKQFFGDPIECRVTSSFHLKVFNAYCWIAGTTTAAQVGTRSEELEEDEAHNGIAAMNSGRRMQHNYYQWVPFILFIQAILFYLPYRLWKHWEGGKLTKLLAKVSNDPLTETSLKDQVQGISKFIGANPGWFNSFASFLFFCELTILLSTVLQMYLLDLIFDGQFFHLGHDFANVDFSWEHYRIVEEVFPLVTSCKMDFIANTGSKIQESAICVLSINILNQKIFIVSWYLHMAMIAFSLLWIVLEVLKMIIPGFRYLLLRYRAKSLHSHVLTRLHKNSSFGQFTLLTLIANNVDSTQFEALLNLLHDQMVGNNHYPSSLINMSAVHNSEGKKFNEDYPPNGKQADSPVITRRPRLMSG